MARVGIYTTKSLQEKNPDQKNIYFFVEKFDFQNLGSKYFFVKNSERKNMMFEMLRFFTFTDSILLIEASRTPIQIKSQFTETKSKIKKPQVHREKKIEDKKALCPMSIKC